MSQAKVDKYKESKKNRKQEVKKAKRKKMLTRAAACIIGIAIVCWIAYSGYTFYQSNKPIAQTEVSLDAINDYISSLTSTDEASGS